jgi:hypothetical protein
MRISNQKIQMPGSVQVTDEYPCFETFPNSHEASNYYEWCCIEADRMANCFVVESEVDIDGELINVCHVRRRTDVN